MHPHSPRRNNGEGDQQQRKNSVLEFIKSLIIFLKTIVFKLIPVTMNPWSAQQANNSPQNNGEGDHRLKRHIITITKLGLNLISVTMDPWLYYVPEINTTGDNQKYRLIPNYKLAFLLLIPYPIFIAHRMIIHAFFRSLEDKEDKKSFVTQLIYQGGPGITAFLLVIILLSSMKSSDSYVFLVVMVPFLLFYSVRIYQIYRWTRRRLNSPISKIWLNLVLYLYGGHVFGGMWYSFAIKKRVGCWNNACIGDKENCSLLNGKYFQRGYNITSTTYLDDTCTNKNLGIFKEAFDSGIVEIKYKFLVKLVYGFRWGLQNLSGFGQNLEPSVYVWENMFVIFITVYGVSMFTYFIGNMQMYIQHSANKSQEKEREKNHPEEQRNRDTEGINNA